MDKINELTKKQKSDEKILISTIIDKINSSKNKHTYQTYYFLDLAQQLIVTEMLEKRKETNWILYGGYENAERKKFFVIPEKYNIDSEEIFEEKMCIIRVNLPKELYNTFEHKSYLGAIMKLGVKREEVGDIIVREDGADIIISRTIENFLLNSLKELTRFQKAKIESLSIKDLKYIEPKKEIFKINIPSMRLDAIVGELARCSRNEANKIIAEERVFVNFKEEIVGSKIIKENTYITIRGKGRFKILNIVGTTRSNRLSVEVEK